jgi:hypothetical protein|nr:MAG TPA: hypothetical protein [Caudoviricetes sp.]
MAEIISFDDEKFLKLYHSPAESEYNNKRARLIYKACEIWHRMKQNEKEKKENEKI